MAEQFTIRYANSTDFDAINRIARKFNRELAFIRYQQIRFSIAKCELLVATENETENENVLGFVLFHARRDGQRTIYDLAVSSENQRKGIGRALLYSVPCPIQLRCTTDNERANRFYARSGMMLVRQEPGKKRLLNVWRLNTLNTDVVDIFNGAAISASNIRKELKNCSQFVQLVLF